MLTSLMSRGSMMFWNVIQITFEGFTIELFGVYTKNVNIECYTIHLDIGCLIIHIISSANKN